MSDRPQTTDELQDERDFLAWVWSLADLNPIERRTLKMKYMHRHNKPTPPGWSSCDTCQKVGGQPGERCTRSPCEGMMS